jgi:hypothetical protein
MKRISVMQAVCRTGARKIMLCGMQAAGPGVDYADPKPGPQRNAPEA